MPQIIKEFRGGNIILSFMKVYKDMLSNPNFKMAQIRKFFNNLSSLFRSADSELFPEVS